MSKVYQLKACEDGSVTVTSRVTAFDGSGSATGVNGEGFWLRQADLSTITCAVYDRSSTTPDTAIATPTVTIASAIVDTPVTNLATWSKDTIGYNFKHTLAGTNFPTANHIYRVEYKFTTSGSAVFTLVLEGVPRSWVTE